MLKLKKILGIDPGSIKMGWALLEENSLNGNTDLNDNIKFNNKFSHLDNGVQHFGKGDYIERIKHLVSFLDNLLDEYRPDYLAIEDIFFHKGYKSALILAQSRGAIIGCALLKNIQVISLASTTVKDRATGNGKASKEQVAYMMQKTFSLRDVPFEDAADALSIAFAASFEVSLPIDIYNVGHIESYDKRDDKPINMVFKKDLSTLLKERKHSSSSTSSRKSRLGFIR